MITNNTRPMAAEFHVMHCDAEDKDDPAHVCQGKVTITVATCTFECARCGTDCANIRQQVELIKDREAFERLALREFGKQVYNRVEQEKGEE